MIGLQDSVEHGRFGLGVVLESRRAGYESRVEFNGYALWVPSSSLTLIASAPPPEMRRGRRSHEGKTYLL